MMKIENLAILTVMLLFCCSKQNNTQAVADKSDSTECGNGKLKAQNDIKAGDLGRYYYGLPTNKHQMYVRILRDEYAIDVKGGGDIVDDYGTCYNEVMDKQIKKKFGDDFFSRIQGKIDSLYSVGVGDQQASYPGGAPALEAFLACNVKIPKNRNDKNKVYLDLQIDTLGNVQATSVRKGIDKEYDSEAIRVSKLLKWNPARENRKPAISRVTIAVLFDPEMKARIKCD